MSSLILKPVAQIIPKGHRLRVAISSSYWPMAWPSPEATMLTLAPRRIAALDLPVLATEEGLAPVTFKEAVWAAAGAGATIKSRRASCAR